MSSFMEIIKSFSTLIYHKEFVWSRRSLFSSNANYLVGGRNQANEYVYKTRSS